MQELISVIIPVYNGEKCIERCITSVLAQSYTNLDVIVINDGSTDKSDKICREFIEQDDRIRYIKKNNEGLGLSRNLGIQLAYGTYITFVDADDWLEERFIEYILTSMIKTNASIGVCDIFYCNSKTGDKMVSKLRIPSPMVSVKKDRSIINKSRTFAWGKIYKRKLFHEGNLYPDWTYEDIPCTTLLLYEANIISYVEQPLYNYWRNQETSLSNQISGIKDMGYSLDLLYERSKSRGILKDIELEIKKIMVGQLRFAYKKWECMQDKEQIGLDLKCLNEIVAYYHPQLTNFNKIKYMIKNEPLLLAAIECVIVSESQLVHDENLADYVIGFEKTHNLDTRKWISISEEYRTIENTESAKWEIAEQIMERM